MNTVVLGAGIAGLSYLYNAKDDTVQVFEKSDRPGGLCKSFRINDFVFDSAVHLSFTGNQSVRNVFDKTDYLTHLPLAYNFYEGKYIKHPVINNLFSFSPKDKCRYIESFISRDKDITVNNYGDWLTGSYGKELKQDFYDKYTLKYWTKKSEELSTSWVGERLQSPDIHKILSGAFCEETDIDYYAKEMRYPVSGGYESFLRPLIASEKIHCNKTVVQINPEEKQIVFADGESICYEKLVSSLPLCEMAYLVKNTPPRIKEAADRLSYSKISIVSVGFNRPDIARYLWMYVYDDDILTARINSPSIKSPHNAPTGCSSLQFEIYHDNHYIPDEKSILKNVEYTLQKMHICQERDILFMDYRLLPYGNVIFYNGMEQDRALIKDYMLSKGIQLIGRFGEWDYLWSDQSYLSGQNAVQ